MTLDFLDGHPILDVEVLDVEAFKRVHIVTTPKKSLPQVESNKELLSPG
jgi:hypothetical protein